VVPEKLISIPPHGRDLKTAVIVNGLKNVTNEVGH